MKNKYFEQGVLALEHFEMSINEQRDDVSFLNNTDTIWRCCIKASTYITASANGENFKVYTSDKFDKVGDCIFSESLIDPELNSKIDAFVGMLK